MGCQKPGWNQARLSSLGNKLIGQSRKEESHAGNEEIGAEVLDGRDNLHLPDQLHLFHADTDTLNNVSP